MRENIESSGHVRSMLGTGAAERLVDGLLDRLGTKLRPCRPKRRLIDIHKVLAHTASIYAAALIYPLRRRLRSPSSASGGSVPRAEATFCRLASHAIMQKPSRRRSDCLSSFWSRSLTSPDVANPDFANRWVPAAADVDATAHADRPAPRATRSTTGALALVTWRFGVRLGRRSMSDRRLASVWRKLEPVTAVG